MTMTAILIGVFLVINVWLIWTFVRDYARATGTPWQRMVAAGQESVTILWSKVLMLLGALSGLIVKAADYLGDTGLSTQLQALLKPEYVGAFVVLVAVITIYARKRTL
jgi:hypothetical protein